ncbi:hypothetical protein FQN60_011594 [Etheostoma spectabile]|uniref:Uncharacterized protein n=1 Tax=Etheostoma spectabile TaxID=54343 RepID=A0A5J5DMP1_9PERO|nr:hypothetical protein FQN60_011594 [Etheostoma spectabile]
MTECDITSSMQPCTALKKHGTDGSPSLEWLVCSKPCASSGDTGSSLSRNVVEFGKTKLGWEIPHSWAIPFTWASTARRLQSLPPLLQLGQTRLASVVMFSQEVLQLPRRRQLLVGGQQGVNQLFEAVPFYQSRGLEIHDEEVGDGIGHIGGQHQRGCTDQTAVDLEICCSPPTADMFPTQLTHYSAPVQWPTEPGDGKEIREEEGGNAAETDIMPESLATSGLDTVVTSLMTSMGLCDWLLSDQREELLGSGRAQQGSIVLADPDPELCSFCDGLGNPVVDVAKIQDQTSQSQCPRTSTGRRAGTARPGRGRRGAMAPQAAEQRLGRCLKRDSLSLRGSDQQVAEQTGLLSNVTLLCSSTSDRSVKEEGVKDNSLKRRVDVSVDSDGHYR